MGAFKRKADSEAASKKGKGASSDRSAKRPRRSEATVDHATPSKAKPESSTPKSIFKDEEKAFPRGGASVLTPLEHKQIQIKATQDVLFEQAGLKRGGDDGLSDQGSDLGEEERRKASKKRKSKKSKTAHDEEAKEPKVKAEGLSSKKLAIGTLVLGQVISLTTQDVVLALPNNLVGYVPLTAVSDKLNERIEKLLKEEEGDDEEDEEDDIFEDIELKNMFTVGQYLRACVTSTSEDTAPGQAAKAKRRIELSIHPKLVNQGLAKSNLVANGMVQASVVSNEDHGLVMDLGLDDAGLKGFLGKSELGPSVQHANVQEGAVFLCSVSGLNPDGRIVKLTADQQKIGHLKKGSVLTEAPTIDVFLPGTAVDMLITDLSRSTISGKLLGLVDATADIIHSGAAEKAIDLTEKLKIGSKIKARIIFVYEESDVKKVGVSVLDHVVSLSSRMSGKPKERKNPLDVAPISSFVEEAEVTRVEPMLGAFFDLGVRDVVGFAHVSKLADGRVETPSEAFGPFQLASKHRARVVGYSAFDGMFQLSLEEKVLAQPYLRVEDVKTGQIVKGKVHKLIADKSGSTALLVALADGITGFVSEAHLADVRLQHPERKFREGASLTARVLSIDTEKHQIRLTLKKTLVNSDVAPWYDFSQLSVGATGPGTLVDIKPSGALVQFYGDLKAWLPAAEMSEAFIEDATRHFTKGQVVNVRVISLQPEEHRMLVSCKDPAAVDADKETAFKSISPGNIVRGTAIEKGTDSVIVDLGHGVKGVLRIGHLTDGSEKKDKSTMERVRVGGLLEDLVVLDKHQKSRTVTLSNKPSLRKAAQAGTLVTKLEDIKAGETVHGFVRGILPDKVFVELGGGVSGAVFKSQLTEEMTLAPNFGLRKDQSITARVAHADLGKGFFWLSLRPEADASTAKAKNPVSAAAEDTVNPVDEKIKSTADLKFGTTLSVRVRSAKSTQVNVRISDNVGGRIHVSELFKSWDDINDKKQPTGQFQTGDILHVKVVGVHDARNYRFLPLSHRQGKNQLFELSNREDLDNEADLLTLDKVSPGASFTAFVNNIEKRHVWVNISANVRGRVDFFDLTDDLSLLADVEENFPVGSALKVRVKAVDVASGRLDLTAASTPSAKSLTLNDLKEGLVLPARVTKLHDSHIVVQINENVAGPIYLEQLADNYDEAKPSEFKVGEIIRICITEIDAPNKKLSLSARPSRVLSSSLPVRDVEVKDRSSLQVGQVVRGFVKKVADNAVFVRLGPHVDAIVRVTHLSDAYIKDWKAGFLVDQLVTGKIIANDHHLKNPQMSLKKSVIEGEYVKPTSFSDIKRGQIVTAKVRHVEDYGVFLVVDNSENVSGMCHISQMADKPVEKSKVKELYKVGDAVKAKVLSVDVGKRRISFGLKYSYIKGEENDGNEDEEMEDASDAGIDNAEDSEDEEIDSDSDVDMRSVKSAEDDGNSADEEGVDNNSEDEGAQSKGAVAGLSTSGFDWTGATVDFDERKAASDDELDDGATKKKKKKHKKATIKEDRTGDLDAYGPQSVADYERLLLGQPNSAELWVRYMVFQRELSEIEKARQIARRALVTINPREEKERLDVWTALLHLENDFASDDLVAETLKEACLNNDAREVHERMIKIYISSAKLDKADNLYQSMTKNKSFTPDPALWLSYATFLMATLSPPSPTRARALLPRATQSVLSSQHRYLTQKFASLEFKLPNGDPERGRTIFEGLVSTWPKKWDIWDVYVSLEISHGGEENVRGLFERMAKTGMKKRRAETVFKRWREWEESVGDTDGIKKAVKAEAEWKEKREAKGDEE
ncbi:rRNA biogenesis protein-like protein RRP5 [Lentithecium fluviatile CBS 122367]|uniref:rRNA biogenesis protein RRP5 n=1 Tax=Lentithecium fluviatile CBS 122367 TaxID=1168545 RepID=A0A6G1ITT7_9PLEO|nr:rRNA biogenesis protein-like protein RRP5 [Lentithecium fluviatile CBS 122367]